MFDVQKQITYWRDTALYDIESAEILIEKGKYIHGLFFCHLVIEKALKAHYVKANNKLAPKTHDLVFLVTKTNLNPDAGFTDLLAALMEFQIEGRYPEHYPKNPTASDAKELLAKTKELLSWLIQRL